MIDSELFEYIIAYEGTVLEEEAINKFEEFLADVYHDLKTDPLRHVNGSVPTMVNRASQIKPGNRLRVEMYRIKSKATLNEIRTFLRMGGGANVGALGLVLMRRILPQNICFIAFEENEPWRAASLRRGDNNELDLGLGLQRTEYDDTYGFIYVTIM